MRFAIFHKLLLTFGLGGTIACGAPGGGTPAETASHSHADHPHEGQPKDVEPVVTPAATGSSGSGVSDSSDEESAAYEKARPVFETFCASCHKTGGSKASPKAMNHFDMDTYPFGGHHAGEITATIRKSLGATGSAPTMPLDRPGAVNGDALGTILFWADVYDRAHPTAQESRTHDHGGHKH